MPSPIAVLARHRKQGVARHLIEMALDRAAAMGFAFVLPVGDPAFCRRFGFVSITSGKLSHDDGIPDAISGCADTPAAPRRTWPAR